MYLPFRFQR